MSYLQENALDWPSKRPLNFGDLKAQKARFRRKSIKIGPCLTGFSTRFALVDSLFHTKVAGRCANAYSTLARGCDPLALLG